MGQAASGAATYDDYGDLWDSAEAVPSVEEASAGSPTSSSDGTGKEAPWESDQVLVAKIMGMEDTSCDPINDDQVSATSFVPFRHAEYSETFGHSVLFRWGLPPPPQDTNDDKSSHKHDGRGHKAMRGHDHDGWGKKHIAPLKDAKSPMALLNARHTPGQHFVSQLVEKKRRDLAELRDSILAENGGCEERRDLVLHVYIANDKDGMKPFTPSVYRKVKISSSLKLSTLADKILAPLMGWIRNWQGNSFCDLADGAMFCAKEHGGPDMVCPAKHFNEATGGDALHPSEAKIGELLRNVGDKLVWTHNICHSFPHIIELIEIIDDEAQVDGMCVVFDGEMRCPPEHMGNVSDYQKGILNLYNNALKNPYDEKLQRKKAEEFYKCSNAHNVRGRFEPDAFDLKATQQAVDEALRSRESTLDEPKKFVNVDSSRKSRWRFVGPGQVCHETQVIDRYDNSKIMTEVVNTKPDPRDVAVCVCGNPNDLTQCSSCCVMWYCSRQCQERDWKVHKQECKTFKKQREEYLVQAVTQASGEKSVSKDVIRLPPIHTRKREDELRFKVGTRVECKTSTDSNGKAIYRKGRIVATNHRESNHRMSAESSPYQIRLETGELIHAPEDDDILIRRLPPKQKLGKKGGRNRRK